MNIRTYILLLFFACRCECAVVLDVQTAYLDCLVGKHTGTCVFHRLDTGEDVALISRTEGVYKDGHTSFVLISVTALKSLPDRTIRATATWVRVGDHYECTLIDEKGHTNIDKMYVVSPGHYHTDVYFDGKLTARMESEVKDGLIFEKGVFLDPSGTPQMLFTATRK